MSKGPWTPYTKRMREIEKERRVSNIRNKIQARKDGFMLRADAATELHKKAIKIATGPSSEWVRFILKVETKKVD